MSRRNKDGRRAEDGIDARRKDSDLFIQSRNREADFGALRAPDPIPLHGEDALRPAGELLHIGQQRLGVLRGF